MKFAKFLEPALKRVALHALVRHRGNALHALIDPATIRRVLVYRPERFGDLLATVPLLKRLRQALPLARISLWTSPAGKELLENEPGTDEVTVVTGSSSDRRRAANTPSFDLVIDMVMRDSVNSLLACASAARNGVLAGWGKNRLRDYYDWAPELPGHSDDYAPELNCRAMTLFGADVENAPGVVLNYTPAECETAAEIIDTAHRPYVLNISAGAKSRHWPEANWRRVAECLIEWNEAPILLNALAADRSCAYGIAHTNPTRIRLLPVMTFREAACIVSQSALFVSADTSLVHIAAGADVPTAAMYLPRRDMRMTWTPPFAHVHTLHATESDTLSSITADDVIASIQSLMPMATSPLRVP